MGWIAISKAINSHLQDDVAGLVSTIPKEEMERMKNRNDLKIYTLTVLSYLFIKNKIILKRESHGKNR